MAKVLIADDMASARASLMFIAEVSGLDVVGTATNGREALELYRELKPDLVTLEVFMRGMDGLMTLEAILQDDPTAKVILVASTVQEEKQVKATVGGASGWIRKPFELKQIVGEFNRVLRETRPDDRAKPDSSGF